MSAPVMPLPLKRLISLGLRVTDTIHYQLPPDTLVQQALSRKEGVLADNGALVIQTGEFTGRSPKDRFIIKDEISGTVVDWNAINLPMEEKYFDVILKQIKDHLNTLPEIWVRDALACADPAYRLRIRIVNETASMNLFACNMFLRPDESEMNSFKPDWHILSAPSLKLDKHTCGTRQHNAVVISFKHKTVLIAGTAYTGEMKKSIFSILNFILPHEKKVMSMHCAANIGEDGDVAVFFGLSGTGKTTLSADGSRGLIGDDEHGWSADGIFNFEGGCYAKCIHLKKETEPEIYDAVRPGALLENVKFFPGTDHVNYDDGSITENSRVSYPLEYIRNAVIPSTGPVPKHIFFLTCDASGTLPPVSKLTTAQAMYQFISGYTAKIAGTETGITEPKLTFSACFGAPFMPLHPGKYAAMLGERIVKHQAAVWLINTGWSGGPFGTGQRIRLAYTRRIIKAVLEEKLAHVQMKLHPVFNMEMPETCPDIPSELLDPRNTWADKDLYDLMAKELAFKFIENFRLYEDAVSEEIKKGAPAV